ncbi:MAG: hypothetical protein ACQGVC_12825 [Myxococcota bacterium]
MADPADEDPLLIVSDFDTLNALSRALVEAKFHAEPIDPAVPGSALVADLATRVADRVEQETARRYPGIHGMVDGWRDPREQPEMLAVVRRRLREIGGWQEWSEEEKRAQVRVLLAPLQPVDEVVRELVAWRDAPEAAD